MELATDGLSLALLVATLVVVTLPGLYLGLLALLSMLPTGTAPRSFVDTFAVLVPAHNEEATIGVLLESLGAQRYPRERFSVHVVADNCTDDTAAAARALGAHVHERSDAARPGKGAALNWLVARVLEECAEADALVFLDADSRVDESFLASLSGSLQQGARVVQALNLVEDGSARPLAIVRVIAFHLFCELRLAGYERLSGSAGLRGNGMCIRRELLAGRSWDESAVVEDISFNLRLIDDGQRVAFARQAVVRSLMPDRLRDAVGQTTRWERGKFDLFAPALRVFVHGLRRRDPARIVAAIDVLLPPHSVFVACATVAIVSAAATHATPMLIAASLGAFAFAAYFVRGIALARVPWTRLVRAFAFLPAFFCWKLWVMARVASGAGRGIWARAERP